MDQKFNNKYRTDSLRLEGYDYSSEGIYFITICTKNRIPYFGIIVNDEMILADAGKVVADEWIKTAKMRGRVVLGEWVIMPNHFHPIIYLKSCKDASHASLNKPHNNERDGFNPSLQKDMQDYKNSFGPQKDNLSSIIRGFKSACTRKIRKNSIKTFGWQSGFYDHIVRNQQSLLKIEEYIRENPRKWIDDDHYSG